MGKEYHRREERRVQKTSNGQEKGGQKVYSVPVRVILHHEWDSSTQHSNCWPGAGAVEVDDEARELMEELEEVGKENGWQNIKVSLGRCGRGLIVWGLKGVEDVGRERNSIDVGLLLHWRQFAFILSCGTHVVPGEGWALCRLDAASLAGFT